MNWDIVISGLITALCGVELWRFIVTRRAQQQQADAMAQREDFHTLKEVVEWLQEQLQEAERRHDEQTQIVRKLNSELMEAERQKAQAEKELLAKRCDDTYCAFRRPPTAYTPSPKNKTKEEYFERRGMP